LMLGERCREGNRCSGGWGGCVGKGGRGEGGEAVGCEGEERSQVRERSMGRIYLLCWREDLEWERGSRIKGKEDVYVPVALESEKAIGQLDG